MTRQTIARHEVGSAASSTAAGQIVLLEDVYPLARHLHAFEAAVGAAGYNAVHELLALRIPTLLIPSVHHATDDQAARAAGVFNRGAALLADGEGLEPLVAELLDEEVRQRLTNHCATLEPVDGGRSAADLIGALATQGAPAPRQRARRPPRPLIDARTPTVVDGATRPLFSESISVNQIHGDHPVEHLVEDSSAAYRSDRHQAAAWLYRPLPPPRDH
ncbi:MAG: glycosyltransferase [Ornithinimicrobium sp.]